MSALPETFWAGIEDNGGYSDPADRPASPNFSAPPVAPLMTTEQATKLLTNYPCCILYDKDEVQPDGKRSKGKNPKGAAWQKRPVKQWDGKRGLGVICGALEGFNTPVYGFDADIVSTAAADAFAAIVERYMPDAPKRIGLAPKSLIPFTLADGEPLTKAEFTTKPFFPDGNAELEAEKCQLEVLGSGNQFVAYHMHPDTQKPYYWLNSEMYDLAPDQLPVLTRKQLAELKAAFEQVMQDHNLAVKKPAKPDSQQLPLVSNSEPLARVAPASTLGAAGGYISDAGYRLHDVLSWLPSSNLDYDEWQAVLAAIHEATRGAGTAQAYSWSSNSTKHEDAEFTKTWNSFGKTYAGKPADWGALVYKAKQNGMPTIAKVSGAELLAAQAQAIQAEPKLHPLTKFISLSSKPEPPRMVIPDLIAEGVVVFAGGHGVGKTTVMLPLAMAAAGVHDKDYELAPKHWRHVIYITEDVYQAQRIITGYGEHLDFNNREIFENIEERVHIVEAQRMKADFLVLAGKYYREKYSRTVVTTGADGKQYITELLPLIVIDTMAATIELENENDNSEASQAIAAIKQRFEGLPTWIIGHVAKANLGRSDAVTLRGAGAFEADANQVLYIVQDDKDGSRWLIRGKTRFESPWRELEIKSDNRIITVLNCFGDYVEIVLRWSVAYPPDSSRAERAKQAKEDRAQQEADQLRSTIIANVMQRYQAGVPLNKTELRAIVGGNSKATSDAVTALLADGWLYEVEVPKGERVPNKPRFLVALDETERAEYQETGIVPPAKQWIPPSWKRQVDDTETEQDEDY